MKVLSLFDGISCGMVALERAGIPVERYVAYEIDETAISISKKNYPNIEHCGDVTTADFAQYIGFDLVMGGFPCQDLSINKANRQGLKGSRSGLFWVLVRAIATIKPRYFLVENNYGMPQEDMDTITETLGVPPILINSALLSPQRRMRLYWTNIPGIAQPADRHLNVIDIIEKADRENLIDVTKFNGKQEITERQDKPLRIGTIGKGGQGERVYSVYGKTVNLTANGGGRGAKTGLYLIDGQVRKLTTTEAERAQTLPDGYTSGHTDSARYKVIGNGWTVDVIAYILMHIDKSLEPVGMDAKPFTSANTRGESMNKITYGQRVQIYNDALLHYGEENQLTVAIEELSECQKEICKVMRGDGNLEHLAEEIADATIMLEQVRLMYGLNELVCKKMDEKVKRLEDRLEGGST